MGTCVDFHSVRTAPGLYFSSRLAAIHRHRKPRSSIPLSNGGSLGDNSIPIALPKSRVMPRSRGLSHTHPLRVKQALNFL